MLATFFDYVIRLDRKLRKEISGGMEFQEGVAGSSPTEKEQKFVPFSFYHNLLYHYLIASVNCPHPYSNFDTIMCLPQESLIEELPAASSLPP